MHSMQAGYLEKAQKYTDKALMQLEKLKSKCINLQMWDLQHEKVKVYLVVFICYTSVLDCSPILSTFQVILLEHIIMCRLVTGHKATALQEVCWWSFLNTFRDEKQLLVCSLFFHKQFFSWEIIWPLTQKSLIADLAGVPAVPAVSQAVHQPRSSASHALSEYLHPLL